MIRTMLYFAQTLSFHLVARLSTTMQNEKDWRHLLIGTILLLNGRAVLAVITSEYVAWF